MKFTMKYLTFITVVSSVVKISVSLRCYGQTCPLNRCHQIMKFERECYKGQVCHTTRNVMGISRGCTDTKSCPYRKALELPPGVEILLENMSNITCCEEDLCNGILLFDSNILLIFSTTTLLLILNLYIWNKIYV